MIMERTFVMLKPDTVKRCLAGEVIKRFERVGLDIAAMKMMKLTSKQVEDFYPKDEAWLRMLGKKVGEAFKFRGESWNVDELEQGRKVKSYLVDYLTSGPVIAMVIVGNDAILTVRKLLGPTDIAQAQAGTIRGDLSVDSVYLATKEKRANKTMVHASGDAGEAKREIAMWFKESEIF